MAYFEGQLLSRLITPIARVYGLVSRLMSPITNIVSLVISIINLAYLLSPPDPPSRIWGLALEFGLTGLLVLEVEWGVDSQDSP